MLSQISSPMTPDVMAPPEVPAGVPVSLINKIRICLGLALLILIAITVGDYHSTRQLLELNRQTTQRSAELQAMTEALSTLKDAETGQRGYLLTQDKTYLDPYETAIRAIPGQLTALQAWSATRSEMRRNVDRFVMLADKKRAELKRSISLNDEQSPAAALEILRAGEGLQMMDDMRAITGAIEAHERDVLAQLLRRSNQTGQWSLYTAAIGSLAACTLLTLSLFVMSRDIAGKNRTGETVRKRTAEQVACNERLQQENEERKQAQYAHWRAEVEVRGLNVGLEERVSERTAQLETANRELEAFSYSVSHDLRSPLRAINGFGQALQEETQGILNEAAREYLERIIRAAHRMGQLIDDLLDLARVSRRQFVRESVDLTELVYSVVAELQEQDPQRLVDVVVAANVLADGDPSLLRVALQNLLENAWKFTGKRPHAKIEFGTSAEQGGNTYFVRDNGAGFDPAFTGKLFGVFQRLHSMEEFAGNGIGLATVQRIIHLHGGRIWASSVENQGATFYFSL